MKHYMLLTCTVLILSACTGAQMQSKRMSDGFQQAGEEMQACTMEVYQDPKYAAIVPYLPAPENDFMPTAAQLAEDKKPTASESKLLAAYQQDNMPCRTAFLQQLGIISPRVMMVFRESYAKQDIIVSQLIKRKISWGTGMQQIQENSLQGQQKLTALGQQMDGELQNMHQSELNQRQAASDRLNQYMLEQQRINAMNQPKAPRMVNCQEFGNGFSCTEW